MVLIENPVPVSAACLGRTRAFCIPSAERLFRSALGGVVGYLLIEVILAYQLGILALFDGVVDGREVRGLYFGAVGSSGL